jgi:hypothetical protein
MDYKKIIVLISGVFIILMVSCEKFDIVRVMDTKTDSIEINSSKIVAYGTILDIGEKKIIQHGHCWSINNEPTVNDYKTDLGEINERDTFISELSKIIPGVEHYIRSYIFDGKEYVYGNTLKFIVTADDIEFSTDSLISLTETNLLVSSSVRNIGSMNFEDYGHCWSQTDPPTIDDAKSAFGSLDSNKTFTTAINNLNMGRYYIRGYLKSAGGVVYSNTVVFESVISVETGIVDVQQIKAIAYGAITSLGVEPIIDHGHCWSLQTSSPTLNNEHNSLGAISKLGPYSGDIYDLIPNQTYYIRSYATDGIHVFYGDVISFTTN